MKSTERLILRLNDKDTLDLRLPDDTVVKSIRRQRKNCIYAWKWFLYSPTHVWVGSYGGAHTVAETLRFKGLRLDEFPGGDIYVEAQERGRIR